MGGKHPDGVGTYPADAHDLQTYDTAQQALKRMPVPVLVHRDNPHEYLYVASFDGSGQDANRRGEPPTNIGIFHSQIETLENLPDSRIAGDYVAGPGTQHNPVVRLADNMLGFSYDERFEEMYRNLARQTWNWRLSDPEAQVRIASVGYSRGAVEIPGFARLVDRYGILDPTDLRFKRDAHGELSVESNKPPLVPPGQIAQAVGLFDPVASGIPRDYDRRLPPSVISGFTLLAEDERRALFPHTALIDQEMTPDGRFLGVTVAGAHSNVGGGNTRNGLEIRAGNVVVDYLNALSDIDYLLKRAVPQAPEMTVVHRSEQAMLHAFAIGASRPGEPRYLREELCVVVNPCRDAEPRDEALAARFASQFPRIGPVPQEQPVSRAIGGAVPTQPLLDDPAHPDHALFRQAQSGVHALDARHQRNPDVRSEQLAGALTVESRRKHLSAIDHVVLSNDGSRVFAVQGALDNPAQHRASVDTIPAMARTLTQSTQDLVQVAAHMAQQHTAARQQEAQLQQDMQRPALAR